MDYIKAILLAIVEGFTEFIPISSTGHLILVEEVLRLDQDTSFITAFMVIIQLPAIMAVVLYFWRDLWPFHHNGSIENPDNTPAHVDWTKQPPIVLRGMAILRQLPLLRRLDDSSESQAYHDHIEATLLLWSKIVFAFIPALVLGFLFADFIEEHLFSSFTVAIMLVIGGIAILIIEWVRHGDKYTTVHEINYRTAFFIGCFQCIAMIPGTSRSAASIIGGLILGANRSTATEFSFILAIPTMLGATAYTLLKHGISFTGEQWNLIVVGSVVSFLVAYLSIAFLMNYIRKHSYALFAYYRIILGVLVLLMWWSRSG